MANNTEEETWGGRELDLVKDMTEAIDSEEKHL